MQEEWIRNFLKNSSSRLGLDGVERLKAIPQTMLTALEFQEPLVQDYQHLLERIKLPDEHDRHVVAAAFWGGAEAILTFNAKDFPEEALDPGDLRVVDPDDYLCELAEGGIRKTSLPRILLEVLKRQRSRLKNPPLDVGAFLTSLRKAGLEKLVRILGAYRNHL